MFIPQLAGQIYVMSGMTTQLNLAADVPGRFLGQNTQDNGEGFPKTKFVVRAMPASAYDQWIVRLKGTSSSLDSTAYAKLLENSVEPKPLFFSLIEPALFHRILARSASSHHMVAESGSP